MVRTVERKRKRQEDVGDPQPEITPSELNEDLAAQDTEKGDDTDASEESDHEAPTSYEAPTISDESGDENDDDEEYNDDDDEDEWDLSLSRWDSEKENLPPCPAFHPFFGTAKEAYLDLFAKFPACELRKLKQERLDLLCKEFEDARHIPKPEPLKIALLGEAGKGKTSLLNSILDKMDLAKTGASGASETTVVTEYGSSFDEQELPFAARIYYFNESRIKGLLEEHVKDYQLWHIHYDTTWETEIKKQYRDKAKTALDVFREMFHGRIEFSSKKSAYEWLQEQQDVETVVSILLGWCQELVAVVAPEDSLVTYVEASTSKELRHMLSPFSTSKALHRKTNPGAALWPLVDRIRIGLKGVRILEHLIFADLPGVSDKNQVRVVTTMQHLHKCDCVWLVASIDRIVSSSVLAQEIDKTFERFGYDNSSRVTVVCTHIESKTEKTLTDLKAKRYNVAQLEKTRKTIQMLEREIKKQTLGLGKLKIATAKVTAMEDIRHYEQQCADLKSQQFNELVRMRNDDVRKALIADYADRIFDHRDLKVFFVSNTEYAKHKKEVEPCSVELSIENTGIPALRSFALTLAARRLEGAVQLCVSSHAPGFLAMVTMWCTKTSVQRPETLVKMVAAPRQEIPDIVKTCRDSIFDEIQHGVIHKMKSELSWFRKEALSQHAKYKCWHHSTYAAWVRNHGVYQTPRQPFCSWNEDFLKPVKKTSQDAWIQFGDSKKRHFEKCLKSAEDALQKTYGNIKEEPEIKLTPGIDAFKNYIASRQLRLHYHFQLQEEWSVKELNDIKLRVTTDCVESYFVAAMQKTYERAKEKQLLLKKRRTSGSKGAQLQQIITQRFDNDGSTDPFAAVTAACAEAVESHVKSLTGRLERNITTLIVNITKQFELLLTNGMDDDQNDDLEEVRRMRSLLEKYVQDGHALVKFMEENIHRAHNAFAVIDI